MTPLPRHAAVVAASLAASLPAQAVQPIAQPIATLIRRRTTLARTGMCVSSLYNGIAAGTFPAPVPTGPRTVAWVESEVSSWIEARIVERDARLAKQLDRRASQTQDARGIRA